ncbi:MAG: flavin reductase family protein [Thermoplasmata archaeon]
MTEAASRFREMMARWPTGVSVVTAHGPEGDAGLTVNAFLSVALRPPLVLIALTADADTTPVIRRARAFVVNVLAHDQKSLSERFALTLPPPEKFRGLLFSRNADGVALLEGTTVAFSCHVVEERAAADHILFLGEVVAIDAGRDVAPLVFFHSDYARPVGGGHLSLPPPKGGPPAAPPSS